MDTPEELVRLRQLEEMLQYIECPSFTISRRIKHSTYISFTHHDARLLDGTQMRRPVGTIAYADGVYSAKLACFRPVIAEWAFEADTPQALVAAVCKDTIIMRETECGVH